MATGAGDQHPGDADAGSATSDMQLDSDVEMDDTPPQQQRRPNAGDDDPDADADADVDIEAVAELGDDEDEIDVESEDEDDDQEQQDEDDGGDEQEQDEDEEQDDDEIQSDADEDTIVVPKAPSAASSSSRGLKIKLKMPPSSTPASTSAALAVPATQPSSRYDTPLGIESEDSMSTNSSGPSTSTTRPMTARQAVLASVVHSSHVSLGGGRSKKVPLNEAELALRREETARKRRNLTEKKLEDEKAETINRLLKKQSRPRNKRTTAQRGGGDMDDIGPGSLAGTRSNSSGPQRLLTKPKTKPGKGQGQGKGKKKAQSSLGEDEDAGDPDDAEEEEEAEEGLDVQNELEREREREQREEEEERERAVRVPTMYRWISTSQAPSFGPGSMEAEGEKTMRITFSVPVSLLPLPLTGEADAVKEAVPMQQQQKSTRPEGCSAPGCTNPFRYRLVRDWTRGACGMQHLKVLEAGAGTGVV